MEGKKEFSGQTQFTMHKGVDESKPQVQGLTEEGVKEMGDPIWER